MSDEQFGEFVCALYTLYQEKNNEMYDGHGEWHRRKDHTNSDNRIQATTVVVEWEGEGTRMMLEMAKKIYGNTILLRSSMDYGKTSQEFLVDDRDFCYAVARLAQRK